MSLRAPHYALPTQESPHQPRYVVALLQKNSICGGCDRKRIGCHASAQTGTPRQGSRCVRAPAKKQLQRRAPHKRGRQFAKTPALEVFPRTFLQKAFVPHAAARLMSPCSTAHLKNTKLVFLSLLRVSGTKKSLVGLFTWRKASSGAQVLTL